MPADKQWDPFAAISRLAVSFQMAPNGAHRRVWNELGPWLRTLAMQAGPKWLPRLSMGFPCHIVTMHPTPTPCTNSAVAACWICKQPTCLGHSFCNVEGEIICYGCATKSAANHSGARHTQQDQEAQKREALRQARKVLEVGPKAAWKTIHRAYKRKVARAHPDQGGTTEEFRRIQEAYELLKAEHEAES